MRDKGRRVCQLGRRWKPKIGSDYLCYFLSFILSAEQTDRIRDTINQRLTNHTGKEKRKGENVERVYQAERRKRIKRGGEYKKKETHQLDN